MRTTDKCPVCGGTFIFYAFNPKQCFNKWHVPTDKDMENF